MSIYKTILLASLILISFVLLYVKGDTAMLMIMGGIVGLLLLFSIVWRVMEKKQASMADEIKKRTVTWWWMAAIFLLALAFNRVVSFVFLGFLCFAALREYFSLIPMSEESSDKTLSFQDRMAVLLCYSAIPLMIVIAYAGWYALFIITIPVYVFLLVPILFVLQNRTDGALRSIGIITLGLMFFVHNLGHCLFMINRGPMLIMLCFVLTEVRDVLSFWIGKYFALVSAVRPDGPMKKILECRVASDVSPNKTWAAGLCAAAAVSVLALVFVPLMPAFPDGVLSGSYAMIVGFAIGILGLFGDMVFSMVKRDLKSKDSGSLLPGHGGIIDRVDSLVFTIPITFHLISWMYF